MIDTVWGWTPTKLTAAPGTRIADARRTARYHPMSGHADLVGAIGDLGGQGNPIPTAAPTAKAVAGYFPGGGSDHDDVVLTDDGRLFRAGGRWKEAMALPEGAAWASIHKLTTRFVGLRDDGTVVIEGKAGGFLSFKAISGWTSGPAHPILSVLGDSDFGVLTMGPGASLQVVGNAAMLLPPALREAVVLGVWKVTARGANEYRVLIFLSGAVQAWRIQLS